MNLVRVALLWVGWPCAALGFYELAWTTQEMDPDRSVSSWPFAMVFAVGASMILTAWALRKDSP